MNTRQYNYLLTIASCEGLSAASKKLGVTQAALSKFLAEQERLLGVKLFLRHQKKMYPTPAGETILETARNILAIKNSTLQTINRLTRNVSPPIVIASTPYRGAELFSRVFSRFSVLFPTVDLSLKEIYSSAQEEEIHRENIDFAFGVNLHSAFPDVCSLPVCREELLLAVPPFHPMAQLAGKNQLVSVSIQSFQDIPFVLPGPKNNIRIMADQIFAQAGFMPVISFESDNGMTVDAMIRKGVGAGFIPKRYLTSETELSCFRLDPPCFEISYIRFHKKRVLSYEETCLLGLLIDERLKTNGQELIPDSRIHAFLSAARDAKPSF